MRIRIFSLLFLLCCLPSRPMAAQEPPATGDAETRTGYWLEAAAEWIVDDKGNAVGATVKGTTNLPKGTRIRVSVRGGEEGYVPVADGSAEITAITRVNGVTASVAPKGNLISGVLTPELTPDTVATFEIATAAIEAGQVVPGTYIVDVEYDYRQKPHIGAAVNSDAAPRSRQLTLVWGAPKTLQDFTNDVKRLFERDLHVMQTIMQEARSEYGKWRRGEMTALALSQYIDGAGNRVIDIAEKTRELPPSDVCFLTRKYHETIAGFASEALIPVLEMARKVVESEVTGARLDIPDQFMPETLFVEVDKWFGNLYDTFELRKPDAGTAVADLERAIAFFTELPAACDKFKAAADEEGFIDFAGQAQLDMADLFARLANNIPGDEAKSRLLECTRSLFGNLAAIRYPSWNADSATVFTADVQALRDILARVKTELEN